MDEIERLGRLFGALRRRSTDPAREARPSETSRAPDASPSLGPRSLSELRDRIRERLGALPGDDPDRGRRAARIFVESVILWEFGDDLMGDPEFTRLVERVDEQLGRDEGLRREFHTVLDELSS